MLLLNVKLVVRLFRCRVCIARPPMRVDELAVEQESNTCQDNIHIQRHKLHMRTNDLRLPVLILPGEFFGTHEQHMLEKMGEAGKFDRILKLPNCHLQRGRGLPVRTTNWILRARSFYNCSGTWYLIRRRITNQQAFQLIR